LILTQNWTDPENTHSQSANVFTENWTVRIALQAYAQNIGFAHEARLPGLVEFTNTQMFFIAMAGIVGYRIMLASNDFCAQNMCNSARINTHEPIIVNGNTGHRYESHMPVNSSEHFYRISTSWHHVNEFTSAFACAPVEKFQKCRK
jgi:hypothetical protein